MTAGPPEDGAPRRRGPEERLVLFAAGRAGVPLELAPGVRVSQRLGDRVALVTGGEAALAELALHPDVDDVFSDEPPADVVERLTDEERLFVRAWSSRKVEKVRPGDGLPWDAPGFLPPDLPPPR